MRQFIIPENILAAILAYLETRPYKEVAQGIEALSSLAEVAESAEVPHADDGSTD